MSQPNTDLVVSRLDAAWKSLQEARTIQETKKVLDAITAAGIYAKRQGLSDEIIGTAHEIRIHALEQLGAMLKATPKNTGTQGQGRPNLGGSKSVPPKSYVPTLEDIGVDKKTSALAQRIASLPPEKIQAIAKRDSTIEDVKREIKEEAREKQREQNRERVGKAPTILEFVGDERFPAIVIDPPWDWGDEGDADQFGRSRPTYGTMSIDEIAALPVGEIASKNAHLYLWITNRSLPKGFRLMEAWGFTYVTAITWVKPTFGLGNYFRGSTEHVLFGVKGAMPLLRDDLSTHFNADRVRGKHSAKPPEFYAMVETCSPGPWIDLFAREARAGWTAWGAEVDVARHA